MRAFSVVLLAAGGSSRLGRPKQLLPYAGTTLVAHAARTALASGASEVIVVVGAVADEVRAALDGLPVRVVDNPDWSSGLGSSISRGVSALADSAERCVLMLVDQPGVTPAYLRALAAKQEQEQLPFVVTDYGGALGPPAVFARELFDRLCAIPGDQGARGIMQGVENVPSIPFPAAALDIDTAADFASLSRLAGPN